MSKAIYSYQLYGNKANEFKKELTKEEQIKYLKLSEQGDYEAKQKLFEHNLRLVSNVINKHYYGSEYNQEELFQVGGLALWESIQKFNLEYNTEFSTYAIPRIIGTIKKFLRNNTIIKISNPAKDLIYKIQKIKEEYRKNNLELTTKQISELLNIEEERIVYILNSTQYFVSLDEKACFNAEDKKIKLEQKLKDSSVSIEEQIITKERNEIISQVIDSLGIQESTIIRATFGIGCERKNQREIARMLNVSQAQVSRIYKISLRRLRYILPNYLDGKLEYTKKLIKHKNKV